MPNRYAIPQLGFGTFGRNGDAGIMAIQAALETGYRHLDTAQSYDTEYECGEALRRSGLPRDEVFLTTKISTDNFDRGALVPSLRASLDAMRLPSVDLTLIHWPSPNDRLPLAVYLEQLAEAHAMGLTRLIGVSNFTIAHLKVAKSILGDLPIVNNQVELNPYLQNKALVSYCEDNAIAVTCYLPIARGMLVDDPVLRRIGAAHDATTAQIALAWEMAKDLIAIPTSGRIERIRSNFESLKITLSPQDMAAIATLDRGARVVDPAWGPDWD